MNMIVSWSPNCKFTRGRKSSAVLKYNSCYFFTSLHLSYTAYLLFCFSKKLHNQLLKIKPVTVHLWKVKPHRNKSSV